MRGLSNRFYTDSACFEFERDHLFAKTWACIGFGRDVPAPGDVAPVALLGIPLILRDRLEAQSLPQRLQPPWHDPGG
jgi:phenylpropionate dioxygenase-like ring-hydroxylating dioxygenase large terminal subunit